jgi:hypothetical protein
MQRPSPAARAAPRPRAIETSADPVAALREQTEVGRELLEELRAWRAALTPALQTVVGFGTRLDALCRWIKTKGPWAVSGVLAVMLAGNAISPELAALVKALVSGVAP